MARKFSSAGERVSVHEEDFEGVCHVLAGGAKWKPHIAPNLKPALKAYGKRSFKVVSAEDFTRNYAMESEDMGFTNKIKSEMVLKEVFKDSREAVMVSALHEMVHWVSHPPEQGKQVTAMGFLGRGLMEGLTQVVTEDLLDEQGITQYSKPIYAERVKIVRKLIARFNTQIFGEALFQGQVSQLKPLVDTYGAGFRKIVEYATQKNDVKAIECIERLNRAADAKSKSRGAGR